ncbi:MAG: hypothetical protein ACP5US_03630 [Candidatus Kryptoniota bacterium]
MILFFIVVVIFTSASNAQKTDAVNILKIAEERVSALDSMSEKLNGEFSREVKFKSSTIGGPGEGNLTYLIKVKKGRQQSYRKISVNGVSDSSIIAIMDKAFGQRNGKPVLEVYNTAFPWAKYLRGGESGDVLSAQILSNNTDYFGEKCYLIKFNINVKNDSLNVSGSGKIWIAEVSYLPVRLESDMNFDYKRGRGRTKTFVDFTLLQDRILVVTRSEFQTFPKFLFVPMGSFKIVIEQKDFNLEYEK